MKKAISKIIYIFLASFLVSYVLAVILVNFDETAFRTDITTFLTGAQIIRKEGGEYLYDLDIQTKYQPLITSPYRLEKLVPYRNPPIVAFLFIPLSTQPLSIAYKIYTLILIIVTLVIMQVSKESLSNIRHSYWRFLPFLFAPSLFAIFMGQISTLLLLFFVLIYSFFRRNKYFQAGISTGFLLLKPPYIISFPFLFILSGSKKEFLRGFLISSTIIIFGSFLISGTDFLSDYLRMLIETESPAYTMDYGIMFTLYSSLAQLTNLSKLSLFSINLTFYFLAILYFFKNYKRISAEISFVVLILFTLAFCIHGLSHDLAILLLPILLLIDVYRGSKCIGFEIVLALFILVLSPLVYVIEASFFTPYLFLLVILLISKKSELQIISNDVPASLRKRFFAKRDR